MNHFGFSRLSVCAVLAALSAAPYARAEGVNFTCNANIDTLADANGYSGSLCSAIQTTLGTAYSSLFTNANANIYIEFASDTGLGASTTGFLNTVSYSTYFNALTTAHSSGAGGIVGSESLASLGSGSEATAFGSTDGQIELTSALAQTLGITSTNGDTNYVTGARAPVTDSMINGGNTSVNDPLSACNVLSGGSNCYNGVIYLQNPGTGGVNYYYGQGTETGAEYDIYSVVEHETDEVLGTASCIDTTGGSLANGCNNAASAVDLFRYTAANTLATFPDNNPAYFSYNSGVTDVANYNYSANGQDYADFSSTCAHVQDAVGCPGGSALITNDGGAEVAILDAVGYSTVTPEPGTIALFGSGLAFLAVARRRRRA